MGTVAKKRMSRRRKWPANQKKVQIDGSLALATLANNDVLSGNIVAVATEEFRWLSLKGIWSIRGQTAGDGPIVFGVAHSDYTDAEIEECLEQGSGLTKGDKIAQEQENRLVRRIGVFNGAVADESVFDGREKTVRLNWAMATGQTLKIFAFNKSGAGLQTGSVIIFSGTAIIRWT